MPPHAPGATSDDETDEDLAAPTAPDSLLHTLLSLQYLQQKVGLANVVLTAAVRFSATPLACHYYSLRYTHTTNTATNTEHRHGMFNQLQTQTGEHVLSYKQGTRQLLEQGAQTYVPEQSNHKIQIPMPPLHIQRRLLITLDGVSVWNHPACRATMLHRPLRPRPPPEPPPPPPPTSDRQHYAGHWEDVGPGLFTSFSVQHCLWVWAPEQSPIQHILELHLVTCIKIFELHATPTTLQTLSSVKRQRLTLLFVEYGTWSLQSSEPAHRGHILKAIMYQMRYALNETNLGRWAEILQASIPYWPYLTLPSLRMVRRKAYMDVWYVHVSPPHFVIYVCINLCTGAMYVGQTTQSPIQRLRKHHTDARAAAVYATFHTVLLTTDISDWITIPVQYCETLFQAGVAERTWWADLRHWAVNDIPPRISKNECSNKQQAYITGTVLHVLQELRQAKQQRDTQRVNALQIFLHDASSKLCLPIHVSGVVVVPNLTVHKKKR